jgi:Ca2+-binding RTX toxin-like protein
VIVDTAVVRSNTSECKVFNGNLECASASQVQVSLGAGFDRMEYRTPVSGVVQLGSGNDSVVAGVRETAGQAIQPVIYVGESGFDLIGYDKATSGVTVDMADGVANDGRPSDRENVNGFEHVNGSSFRDTLFGTPGPDGIAGGLERDIIAGGGGDDFFYSGVKDGADDYHGGPGSDSIEYFGRTLPLTVQLDNTANDGEAGEADNVRSNVENVFGGSGADTLSSFSAFSRLEGRGGADRLNGGDGPDTLVGGPGGDSLEAGAGNDVVDARDGEPDFVDCGTEADGLSRDIGEGAIKGCESAQVGVLRLAAKAIDAQADEPAPVTLSWRHPDGWRKLRTVTLRLVRDGVAVGDVTIRPRGKRINAEGS